MARKRYSASPQPAVSGPGRLARRTDRSPTQAPSPIPASFQGERQQLQELQAANPIAGGGGVQGGAPQRGGAPPVAHNVFGPTQRPTEPITAGIATGAGVGPTNELIPTDPMELLRIMASVHPDPYLLRLLDG